ncbi:MAG: alpha/beta hydrolase [Polyangiales bacterium]
MVTPITDLVPWLVPELREVFAVLPAVPLGPGAIRRERKELDALSELAGSDRFYEVRVPGLDGEPPVRVKHYRPAAAAERLRSALVWMHGGAWSLGIPEFDEPMLQRFADESGCVVLAVDYRLAPEHPFPAALLDCEAVVRWAFAQATELGVDPTRVCVGGSSAGANLAAGLCLKLCETGANRPALQVLMYPALDDALDSASMLTLADPRTLTRAFMHDRWQAYLGTQGQGSPYAIPARASDAQIAALSPALILAAELDPLRDEGVAYATRLWRAAVSCELHVLPGAIHGFDAIVPDSGLARAALQTVTSRLRGLVRP